jgi:OPA family glycerol-3-phosphate transporter-like MFS transporter
MGLFNKIFKPAPHIERLSEDKIPGKYKFFRWGMLEATFIGYATFYLVRNNLAVVSKNLETAYQIDASMYGNIVAATAIAYGLGKFLMGSVSDRSNPKRFMPFGLILTALLNFAFGGLAFAGSLSGHSIYIGFLVIWALNGFVQGMGWPPCGRTIGHWYSVSERGTVFAVWNIAHNIGGGLAGVIAAWGASQWGWQAAFFVPGIIAMVNAVYLFLRLRDTPQSVGLPPIEEYHNDYPAEEKDDHEKELETRDLFVNYIFKNKYLWLFAIANFFVYIVRYSMLDYGPRYLEAVKGGDLTSGGLAILILEFGGIPSTILMGWVSDKLGGRRGMVSLLCMFPILLAFFGLYMNPPGSLWLDMIFLGIIGFFIYPPVMLLGVSALDLTSKKAVGAAAGFVGLFGYLGRAAQGKALGTISMTSWGYDGVIFTIIGCTFMAIILLAFTWNIKPRG